MGTASEVPPPVRWAPTDRMDRCSASLSTVWCRWPLAPDLGAAGPHARGSAGPGGGGGRLEASREHLLFHYMMGHDF